MTRETKEISTENLGKIAEVLKEKSVSIQSIDIFKGNMGLVIFFYHYSRLRNDNILDEHAGELIEQIYANINVETPLHFKNGLCGIGWGIEHLVQNKLVDADADEVLGELDTRVVNKIIHDTPINLTLKNGLTGYGLYLLNRIKNPLSSNDKLPTLFNKNALIKVINEIEFILIDKAWDIEKIGTLTDLLALLFFLFGALKERTCYAKTVHIINNIFVNLKQHILKNVSLKSNLILKLALNRIKSIWSEKEIKIFEVLECFESSCSINGMALEDAIFVLFISNELFRVSDKSDHFDISTFLATYISDNHTLFVEARTSKKNQDIGLEDFPKTLMIGLAFINYLEQQ